MKENKCFCRLLMLFVIYMLWGWYTFDWKAFLLVKLLLFHFGPSYMALTRLHKQLFYIILVYLQFCPKTNAIKTKTANLYPNHSVTQGLGWFHDCFSEFLSVGHKPRTQNQLLYRRNVPLLLFFASSAHSLFLFSLLNKDNIIGELYWRII